MRALSTVPRAAAVAACLFAAACGGKAATEAPPAPVPGASTAASTPAGKTPHAIFETTKGRIVCRLFPEDAPKTVENFVSLATGKKTWTDPATGQSVNRPLYDGTIFHRVIPGFMIQGGDPLGRGTGGPGYRFEDEFSGKRRFERAGILAMANSGPNTNGSQFFITVAPTPWLDNKHTIFGEVVDGQQAVDAVTQAPRSQDGSDRPVEPIVVKELKIEYR